MKSASTRIRPAGEVPRPVFKYFANAEITDQQLLGQSFILFGSVCIALNSNLSSGGIRAAGRRRVRINTMPISAH